MVKVNQILKWTIELLGIVVLRFRTIPRIWGLWLIAINGTALAFSNTIEAQVSLIALCLSLFTMVGIYGRSGYIRLIGLGHFPWLLTLPWLIHRLGGYSLENPLAIWLMMLIVTNGISLIIDTIDGIRFFRGETSPFYFWKEV